MIQTITGNKDFIESLRGKRASFLLCMSNTKTANIVGITQAGIPGMLHLTPTLDAEFIAIGEVRSLGSIAETPKGVPTPALITRAVHLLHPFREIELIELGLEIAPKLEHLRFIRSGLHPVIRLPREQISPPQRCLKKGFNLLKSLQCRAITSF
jgi:NaMN:DMB phosphoribosyltransferase